MRGFVEALAATEFLPGVGNRANVAVTVQGWRPGPLST